MIEFTHIINITAEQLWDERTQQMLRNKYAKKFSDMPRNETK